MAYGTADALVAVRSHLGVDDAADVLRQELLANLDAVNSVLRRALSQIYESPEPDPQ